MKHYCFQLKGKERFMDFRCSYLKINKLYEIGTCEKTNFTFKIPRTEDELIKIKEKLIDGQYIKCDNCPLGEE